MTWRGSPLCARLLSCGSARLGVAAAAVLALAGPPAFAQDASLEEALRAEANLALVSAAAEGDADAVIVAIGRGADIDAQDDSGFSALMFASLRGYREVVAVLLAADADPDLASAEGATPLMGAALMGHLPIVKLLVDAGADLSAKNVAGATARTKAEEYGRAEVAKFLREAEARRLRLRARAQQSEPTPPLPPEPEARPQPSPPLPEPPAHGPEPPPASPPPAPATGDLAAVRPVPEPEPPRTAPAPPPAPAARPAPAPVPEPDGQTAARPAPPPAPPAPATATPPAPRPVPPAPSPDPPPAREEPREAASFIVDPMERVFVILKGANIRMGPDREAPRAGSLEEGSYVVVTGKVRDRNWYRLGRGARARYLFGSVLGDVQRDLENAPAPAPREPEVPSEPRPPAPEPRELPVPPSPPAPVPDTPALPIDPTPPLPPEPAPAEPPSLDRFPAPPERPPPVQTSEPLLVPVLDREPVAAEPAVEALRKRYVAPAGATLRSEPSASAAVLGSVLPGSGVLVNGRVAGGWLRVDTGARDVFVAENELAEEHALGAGDALLAQVAPDAAAPRQGEASRVAGEAADGEPPAPLPATDVAPPAPPSLLPLSGPSRALFTGRWGRAETTGSCTSSYLYVRASGESVDLVLHRGGDVVPLANGAALVSFDGRVLEAGAPPDSWRLTVDRDRLRYSFAGLEEIPYYRCP